MEPSKTQWSEHVILVDAEFLDSLVLDFAAHFSKRIGRPLGKMDLCHWLDCLLLDLGIQEGSWNTFVAFLYPKHTKGMKGVHPGLFQEELHEKAFADRLGEFTLDSFPVEAMTTSGAFMADALKAAMESDRTKQILVVGDMNAYADELCAAACGETQAEVTLFTMTPLPPGKYKTQLLGYSVMSALGIKSSEL